MDNGPEDRPHPNPTLDLNPDLTPPPCWNSPKRRLARRQHRRRFRRLRRLRPPPGDRDLRSVQTGQTGRNLRRVQIRRMVPVSCSHTPLCETKPFRPPQAAAWSCLRQHPHRDRRGRKEDTMSVRRSAYMKLSKNKTRPDQQDGQDLCWVQMRRPRRPWPRPRDAATVPVALPFPSVPISFCQCLCDVASV